VIGKRIRDLRVQRGMSLRELADGIGLTPSGLSQIENGHVDPAVRTLRAISQTLNVPIFHFFIDDRLDGIVVRRNQRRSITWPNRLATHELLTPDLQRKIEMVCTNLEPGASTSDEPVPHSGDECLLVLEGTAEIIVADRSYVLGVGDSIYIDGGLPHRMSNVGGDKLVTVAAFVPPGF
jgi:transcriptional regulator with XRE-family HTH domain